MAELLRCTYNPDGRPISLVRTGVQPIVRYDVIDNVNQTVLHLRPGSCKARAIEIYNRYVARKMV